MNITESLNRQTTIFLILKMFISEKKLRKQFFSKFIKKTIDLFLKFMPSENLDEIVIINGLSARHLIKKTILSFVSRRLCFSHPF